MALEDKTIQQQTQICTGDITVEQLDWPIAAWQEAVESVKEEDDTGVLVTREIRDYVLKLPDTYSSTKKARDIIAEWVKNGIVEVTKTKRPNLFGIPCTQMGFKLMDNTRR